MDTDDPDRDLDPLTAVVRATERHLNAFLENGDDMVALLSPDSTILYASPATKRLLGYSDHEFIGQRAYEFVHPDDHARARRELSALNSSTQPLVAEARFRHRDGTWRTLRGTFTNKCDDPIVGGIVVNYRDITAERAAEAAFRALREHATYAFDVVGVGLWELELRSGAATISDSMAAILGMKIEEFGGTMGTFLHLIHADDRPRVNAARERMLSFDAPYDVQFRVIRPDGSLRWIHAKARAVRDGLGKPERVIGASIDITDRKQLESQLEQTQRLEALGELAGGIVHDFNNILTAVLGTTELLEDSIQDSDPRRANVTAIHEAALSGQRLTKQLLAFSRKQSISPVLVDLNDVVRESNRLVRMAAGSRIVLRTELAPEAIPIRIDRAQFEQILLNLAVNATAAIEATGTITIRATTTTRSPGEEVDSFGVSPGRYAELLFEDTGSGMPPEVQARVFEPFFSTKPDGTGLGMATVYGIVRQAGGYIRLSSTVGRGTTFFIGLPLAK